MVDGVGAKTVKVLVHFFNFLASLFGAIIFIASIVSFNSSVVQGYLMKELAKIPNLNLGELSTVKGILIGGMAVGGVIFLCGFVGSFGALSENKSALTLDVLVKVILAIVGIAFTGTISIDLKDEMYNWSNGIMNKTAVDANKNATGPACGFFQEMANQGHCCWTNGTHNPSSNCQVGCGPSVLDKGCNDYIGNALWKDIKIVGIILVVLIGIEIAAAIFACCLCIAIRHCGGIPYGRM